LYIDRFAISKICWRLETEFSKKSFPYIRYEFIVCKRLPKMPLYLSWNLGRKGKIFLRVGETTLDFFISEVRQNMISSSKSIRLGVTRYSNNGSSVSSIIYRKLAAK
jgi:hypothetical protein